MGSKKMGISVREKMDTFSLSFDTKELLESINLNIIGTANIVEMCAKYKVKIIYFSTGYVYEGKKGNYSDTLLQISNTLSAQ